MSSYAMELIRTKQYQQGLSLLNRAYALDQNSSLTCYYIAYSSLLAGDPASAEKFLKKALEIFPSYQEAAMLLADVYLKTNRRQDAIKSTSDYLKINPSDTTAQRIFNNISDTVHTLK
jgi:tetratricopeptide (TPR) repeat protein